MAGWPVLHVEGIPGNTAATTGQCDHQDATIAKWCAAEERVIVSIDTDFRARWVKTNLLIDYGVEAIVFSQDVKGLREQHRRVTIGLPRWDDVLGRLPYGFRVWSQRPRGDPSVIMQRRPH